MDGKTRSSCRRPLREDSEVDFPKSKTCKSQGKFELSKGFQVRSGQWSLGSPSISKQRSQRVKPSTTIEKIGKLGQQLAKNNNAQLLIEETNGKSQTARESNPQGLIDAANENAVFEGDHINVQVRDSEDEFLEEDPPQSDQNPEEYNEELGSEQGSDDDEEEDNHSNESEVVISDKTRRLWAEQEKQQVNKIANHPDMQKYIESMVGQKIQLALNNSNLAAKLLAQANKKLPIPTFNRDTPGRSISFVKRVVHNVKPPSDTTIYASALNLMPE